MTLGYTEVPNGELLALYANLARVTAERDAMRAFLERAEQWGFGDELWDEAVTAGLIVLGCPPDNEDCGGPPCAWHVFAWSEWAGRACTADADRAALAAEEEGEE